MPYAAACVAAAAALVLAYANHFHNSFHFDDSHAVEQNLFIRDLRNVPLFFRDARTFSSLPVNQSYRPLVTTTLALDYRLGGGLDPLAFHVDSFAWLALQCGLMLLLFRRILDACAPHDRNRWLALFGAALYGLHTAIAETVNYVIARSDILSTVGAVACVWMYAALPRARRWQLHVLPAVAAVLAKEQGAMAAPLLVLYVGIVEQGRSLGELLRPRALWAAVRPAVPVLVACAAAVALAIAMPAAWTPGGTSRLLYALTQPFVVLRYLALFVLPVGLTADSDWTVVSGPLDPRVLAGVAFLAALLWGAWRASRQAATRPAAFGLLWFLVALLPTSSVVPLAEVTNDHRLYFPFVGLALVAANAGGVLLRRLESRGAAARPWRTALAACAVLLLAAHAVGVHERNEVWRSEESLWRDVTEKSPRNGRGWMNYGLALMSRGDYPGAERAFRTGLQLAPAYAYLHVNMAIVQGALGRPAAADEHFRIGLRLAPDVPSLKYFYARWLNQVGRTDQAIALLRAAIAESPAAPSPRELLMQILAQRGRWSELEEAASATLAVRSDDPEARRYLDLARRSGAARSK